MAPKRSLASLGPDTIDVRDLVNGFKCGGNVPEDIVEENIRFVLGKLKSLDISEERMRRDTGNIGEWSLSLRKAALDVGGFYDCLVYYLEGSLGERTIWEANMYEIRRTLSGDCHRLVESIDLFLHEVKVSDCSRELKDAIGEHFKAHPPKRKDLSMIKDSKTQALV